MTEAKFVPEATEQDDARIKTWMMGRMINLTFSL